MRTVRSISIRAMAFISNKGCCPDDGSEQYKPVRWVAKSKFQGSKLDFVATEPELSPSLLTFSTRLQVLTCHGLTARLGFAKVPFAPWQHSLYRLGL